MKPSSTSPNDRTAEPARRRFFKMAAAGVTLAGLAPWTGCKLPSIFPSILRTQSPDDSDEVGPDVKLVGEVAIPTGMNLRVIESIGLVTGLADTGSDPPPSAQRQMLVTEMQKRGVAYPNQVLRSKKTQLVLVKALLRPGIQKGDPFDIEVRVPTGSLCTSLRGGWLMECRLKEMALVQSSLKEGKPLALAQGPILVDPSADGEADRVKLTRGRVLGGGLALESRKLGLIIKPEFQNVSVSYQIGTAINNRFHTYKQGVQEAIAKPETDKYVEIQIHPRYKDNVERFMRVVRSLAVRETPAEKIARLALLERQLLEPITSAQAALRLEAIGKEGVPALRKGIASGNEEVRFYAAEALAYLDETEAVEPLADSARRVRAFRAYALTALSAMDDFAAAEALRELLELPSAETRYGAFRALWAMKGDNPLVHGENLGDQFSYHALHVDGPALIHATKSRRPEIVLFGAEQRLKTPLVLEAGTNIQIVSQGGDQVTLSRFRVDEPDQKRVVSNKLDDVIREIVALGGTYPDVFQALQQASASDALEGKFAIDATPTGGRTYERESPASDEGDSNFTVANPLPGLFSNRATKPENESHKDRAAKNSRHRAEKAAPKKSLLDKLTGRD